MVALIVLFVAVLAAAALVTATLGRGAVANARAQASADAVALAATLGGVEAGQHVADRNGAAIVELDVGRCRADVTIFLSGVSASAAAMWEVVWMPPAGGVPAHRMACRGF